jgi:hypothetical protein
MTGPLNGFLVSPKLGSVHTSFFVAKMHYRHEAGGLLQITYLYMEPGSISHVN